MKSPKLQKLSLEEIQSARAGMTGIASRPRIPVVALLDDIRSLHNVGSIFRTADGAFLEKLYLCGITGCPPRSEIRKTSLGAEESVPWEYEEEPLRVIRRLREKGYQIVALEHTNASVDYRQAYYNFPLCLLVGHEFHGVREELVAEADLAVEIPMLGLKQSLNVSVAFGIAVYQILSQWEQKK
jgi:tRNA G18 (ribose-2'-O)-methylase SpoU